MFTFSALHGNVELVVIIIIIYISIILISTVTVIIFEYLCEQFLQLEWSGGRHVNL